MGSLAVGRLALAALAGVLAAALAACGERTEPTGPSRSLYPVTVTFASKPAVIPRPARRIAVLAPDVEPILVALGAGGRIVGTPLAANGSIRIAQLRSLAPDLLVASSATDSRQLAQARRALPHAFAYVASDDSVRGVEQTTIQLGLLTNESVRARRIVRAIEQKRAYVRRKLRGVPPVTVFVDLGFFTTVSSQSLIGDLLHDAHARNVVGEAPQVGAVDLSELARLDPRFYLASSDSGTTLAKLRRNRRTRRLAAVRAGRFAVIGARLLEPGPHIGQAVVELARLFHPDAFR